MAEAQYLYDGLLAPPALPAHRYAGPDDPGEPPHRPPEYHAGEVCAICTHLVNGICEEWEWEVDPFGWCNTFDLQDAIKREFQRQEKAELAGEQGAVKQGNGADEPESESEGN